MNQFEPHGTAGHHHGRSGAPVSRRYNIVWLLNCFSAADLPDGASLRYSHYAQQLAALGHRVHFLVPDWGFNQEYLRRLVEQGAIAGFTQLSGYRASGGWNALSRLCTHPGIRNRILRVYRRPQLNGILAVIQRHEADVFICGERMHLFVIPELREHASVVIDWADSNILYSWRAAKRALFDGDLRGLAREIWSLAARVPEEIYYTRQAAASILVSPADKRVLGRLSGVPDRIHLLLNGVASPSNPIQCEKVPDWIIFSGRMDFPPNYESALWFLDKVLPLVQKKRPAVHCAIAAGTYVVGTSYATEALNNELLSCVTVADGASSFAEAVLNALQNPGALAPKVERAQNILRRDFSWEARTQELVAILDAARFKMPFGSARP